jgi:single-stranded-DNA-specific exonuclease
MKRWTIPDFDPSVAVHLQTELNIHPVLCQLLAQRGISDWAEARAFFQHNLTTLHNPYLMKDMDRAVERLQRAITRNERILLYGDYDVDGTTSVALMYAFLSAFYSNLDYYLPDRYKEGYGVSLAGVEYARETGCTLVIAMDCGIKAHAAILQARAYNIDFIVCDHHVAELPLPQAVACLDPKRADCPYPYKELSGCGISFKLAQAYAMANNTPADELAELLDLVALSISCDVVPMTGENRTLAHFGLAAINRQPRLGLWAMIEQSDRKNPLIISELVFGLGPLINAAGRLADAREAVRLMLATDKNAAMDAAVRLARRNKDRREVDQSATASARQMWLDTPDTEQRRSIVLYHPDWHKGIIGITASRIAEEFFRPTVILTLSDGKAVGSGRSVGGFDLHDALGACSELFYAWGGHAHAAGVQMPVEQVPLFVEMFDSVVHRRWRPDATVPTIEINGYLDLADITPQLWQTIQRFAPFGPHNMTPVFWATDVLDTGRSRLLKGEHLQISIQQGNGPEWKGIGFGLGAEALQIVQNGPFDMAFSIQEDVWQGQSRLRLHVKDVRAANPSKNLN